MSSLPQLRIRDGYREAEADREWKCQKQAATRGAYRVANQQSFAWVDQNVEGPAGF